MDRELLERIERIEREMLAFDKALIMLERGKEEVRRADEEYGDYLDRYHALYNDEPLSIRAYYQCTEELDRLCQLYHEKDADFKALDLLCGNRIRYLERVLAA
jgi:hypothetical protein